MSDTEGGWSAWADREEGKLVKEPGDFKEGRGQQGSLVCMDKGSTEPAREFDPRLTSKSCFPGNLINPAYNTR